MTAALDWFINDRFSIFIHWGIYVLAAHQKWVKESGKGISSKIEEK
jgi:hypothetical protein